MRPARSGAEWDALVAARGGCGLQTYDWLSAVVPALGQDLVPLVVEELGTPVGVVPITRRRTAAHMINALPFPYAGPLVPARLAADTWTYLAEMERVSSISQASYSVVPSGWARGEAAAGLDRLPRGARTEWRQTWVIDVGRGLEACRGEVSRGRRALLRRGERVGIRVRAARPAEVTGSLGPWAASTYRHQDLPTPYPPEVYEALARWTTRGDHTRIAAAVGADDEPLAIMVTVGGAPVASGWAVHRRPGAPYASEAVAALYWDSVVWSVATGAELLDLGGEPRAGVSGYKRGWGATSMPYLRVRSVSATRSMTRAARQVLSSLHLR
jgi:hypothetical protein